jgi:RimJ/RimL family protein N-acetyltransferase
VSARAGAHDASIAQASNHAAIGVRRVVLSDGGSAELQPIRATDADGLRALHAGLSGESRYFRYFSWRRGIGERELERFTHPDGRLHAGLVAVVSGQIVAHACFDRCREEPEAEIAFEVADAHQGRGLGTLLVEGLAEHARAVGVERFAARVLPENHACLRMLDDLGFGERRRFEDGAVVVTLDLDPARPTRPRTELATRASRSGHAPGAPERKE